MTIQEMGIVPKPVRDMNIPMSSVPDEEVIHSDSSSLTPISSIPPDVVSDVLPHSNVPSAGNNPTLSTKVLGKRRAKK